MYMQSRLATKKKEGSLVNEDQTNVDSICPTALAAQHLHASDAREFPSTLPVPDDELLTSSWNGLTPPRLVPVVIAITYPSAKHPGLVHYEVISLPDGGCTYSKRPFNPSAVGFALDILLKPYGLTAGNLKWKKSDALAPDAA
jgi:hypothetical protein